jgi:hypothetical protein
MATERFFERLFGVVFGRWWAGLLFGAALIAGGALIFWALPTPEPGPLQQRRIGRQTFAAGALAFAGLCFIIVGLYNLFGRDSEDVEPPRDSQA